MGEAGGLKFSVPSRLLLPGFGPEGLQLPGTGEQVLTIVKLFPSYDYLVN